MALIISGAPAWTPSSRAKPFQEGDTDSTQLSKELTNAGPETGDDLGAGACHGAFYVRALKMAGRSVDYDQMPQTFWDGLFQDGSHFKYAI